MTLNWELLIILVYLYLIREIFSGFIIFLRSDLVSSSFSNELCAWFKFWQIIA